MQYKGFLLTVWLIVFAAATCRAQRDRSYDDVVVTQTRIDARDLGYPPVDVIPNGESGITSLAVAPNGDVYGATSGTRAHLFVLSPRHGYVQPLGVLPLTTSVTNAIAISAAGDVYLGTSPDGHILRYTPREADRRRIEIGRQLLFADLGQPVKGESVYTLVIDREANVLYGLTSPNAHFFSYSIADSNFHDFGVVSEKIPFGEKFEKEKMMSRMLAVDRKGIVFVSGEGGVFFRFDPKVQKLERLAIHVPSIPGRESWMRADAFLVDPSGMIYGGTSDGYLFRLDPDTLTVTNLGKPLNQNRIDGLVHAPDGQLYGVGGDQDEMARLFSYDPRTGAYKVLGFIDVNRRPYYTWQAYVIGALVCGSDGTVYIGENERISKLYLFYP